MIDIAAEQFEVSIRIFWGPAVMLVEESSKGRSRRVLCPPLGMTRQE